MSNIEKNNQLLIQAAENGDAVEVQRLIPISDPTVNYSEALQMAAQNGHTQCVKLLIPVSDPKAQDSAALWWAALQGHISCLELLIPVSDPKDRNSWALVWATVYGYPQCVELLYPVSDPAAALKELQHQWPHDRNKWGQLQEMIEVERVRNTLNAEVNEVGEGAPGRKHKM